MDREEGASAVELPDGDVARGRRFAPLRDARLDVLDRLDLGVWITDVDEARLLWANRAAVAIWRATDLDELLNRPNTNSETARATLLSLGALGALAVRTSGFFERNRSRVGLRSLRIPCGLPGNPTPSPSPQRGGEGTPPQPPGEP